MKECSTIAFHLTKRKTKKILTEAISKKEKENPIINSKY